MKNLLLLLFLTFSNLALAQTIKDLEHDLSIGGSRDTPYSKIQTARKLQTIDPFNFIAINYICDYYIHNQIDSISIFFDLLILDHPTSAEPFALKAQLLGKEKRELNRKAFLEEKIKILTAGLNVEKNNFNVTYSLVKIYYDDFIGPFEEDFYFKYFMGIDKKDAPPEIIEERVEAKKSVLSNSAKNALKYLSHLWQIDLESRKVIYFPIKQLECYLSIEKEEQLSIIQPTDLNSYFPISYFANLKEDWECDLTINYLFQIRSSQRSIDWLETQLKDLHEDPLFTQLINKGDTIYRFTWLRSFDAPICVRIEKKAGKRFLYWKIGKGAAGYEPRGLKKSRKKRLRKKQWEKFNSLIKQAQFDQLPNENYVAMTDGASWTLELKTSDYFKAHKTNEPIGKYEEACLYLLDITNIRLKKDDIY